MFFERLLQGKNRILVPKRGATIVLIIDYNPISPVLKGI